MYMDIFFRHPDGTTVEITVPIAVEKRPVEGTNNYDPALMQADAQGTSTNHNKIAL